MAHWAEDDMEYEDGWDGDEEDEEFEPLDPDMDEMGYPIGSQVASADFGLVEVEDEEHGSWLRQRERESVSRVCTVCERTRTMHRDYAICGSCADAAERGWSY